MDKTYYVYVLRSMMDATLYVGMSEDVVKRLDEHNRGKSQFTKAHQPWELIYSELVGTRELARKREKYYKSTAGKNYLRKHGFIKD